jgi:hypothetical protein
VCRLPNELNGVATMCRITVQTSRKKRVDCDTGLRPLGRCGWDVPAQNQRPNDLPSVKVNNQTILVPSYTSFRPPWREAPKAVSGAFSAVLIFMSLFFCIRKMNCCSVCLQRFGGSTFCAADRSGMRYLIEFVYKKCWEVREVRQYVRRFLSDDLNYSAEKLLNILDELAAVCLGESDDLPPPP